MIPLPCGSTPEKENMPGEPRCGKTSNTNKARPLAPNYKSVIWRLILLNVVIMPHEPNPNSACSERCIRSMESWPTKYITTELQHEKQRSKNIL